MTFAQRRNRLTTHFSERIPVVKRRLTVSVAHSVNLVWKFFTRTSSSKRDFHENPLSDSEETSTHNFIIYWPISLKISRADLQVTTMNKFYVSRKTVQWRTPCTLSFRFVSDSLHQCVSTFVRPRPGKFFFIRRGPGPNRFTRKYLSIF